MATLDQEALSQLIQSIQAGSNEGITDISSPPSSLSPPSASEDPANNYANILNNSEATKRHAYGANKAGTYYTDNPTLAANMPKGVYVNNPQRPNYDGQTPQQGNNLNINTQLNGSIFSNLETQMLSIQKIEDPLEKQNALMKLKETAASTAADLSKQTRLMAENEVGLSGLSAALKHAEDLDRKDPEWSKHLVDSRETAGIRNEYFRAQERAGVLTNRMLKENPTLAGMSAKLDSFVKSQENLVNKELGRDEKKQEYIDQIKLSLGNDTVKYLTYAVKGIENNPDKAASFVLALQKDPNRADFAPILSQGFTEDDLLPLAYTGNRIAKEIAIQAQIDKTGQAEDKVRRNFATSEAFVGDENFFKARVGELARVDHAYANALKQYSSLDLLPPSKNREIEKKAMRISLVNGWMKAQSTQKAMNDVESWGGDISPKNFPGIAASMDKIKTLNPGKSVSMDSLVDDYVLSAPNKEQAQRYDEVLIAMKSMVETREKGLFGQVDLKTLENKLRTSTSMKHRLLKQADRAIKGMDSVINSNPILEFGRMQGNNLLDALSSNGEQQ